MNYQQELIQAIYSGSSKSLPPRAMDVYKNNLHLQAQQVIENTFPTLSRLIGHRLSTLASDFLQKYSFKQGDWGEWGSELPEFIVHYPMLSEFPYLTDVARLDWVIHQCERAADHEQSPEKLLQLAECDLDNTFFICAPGLRVLSSQYPIVSIYQAHLEDELDLTQAQLKLRAGEGEFAIIWRKKWKALVKEVTVSEFNWVNLLISGYSIGSALEEAGSDFDFTSWFTEAFTQGYIHSIR